MGSDQLEELLLIPGHFPPIGGVVVDPEPVDPDALEVPELPVDSDVLEVPEFDVLELPEPVVPELVDALFCVLDVGEVVA